MKESNERKLKNFATGLAVGGISSNNAQGAIDTLQ